MTDARWTIYVCTGCGQATGRHKDCDARREAVEVVPAEALDMAIYHADNLQRVLDRSPVRDLAESRAGLEAAREALNHQQTP